MITRIAVAALLAAGFYAPAASADTTPPELRSITFSRQAVTVSGLSTDLLFVTARLIDETGVDENAGVPGDQAATPLLRVGDRWITLHLGTGTAQDGVWSGGIVVTSDWASKTYEPEFLAARDTAGNELEIDPRTFLDTPSVVVTTSNKPRLTLTFSPDPAPRNAALTQIIRVVDPSTGRGWAGVPIGVGYDNACAEDPSRYPAGYTDPSGELRLTHPAGQTYDFGHCAWVSSDNVPRQPTTLIAATYQFPTYRSEVTAHPASSSAPAGTNVAVTGTITPAAVDVEVQLQRRYPDNSWRTVNRARTDQDSAFRVLATPPGTATYSYRVVVPAGTSPVFTIRGT